MQAVPSLVIALHCFPVALDCATCGGCTPSPGAAGSAFASQFGKKLQPLDVERVAAAEQSSDALFLRAMLDELRQFGEPERIGERISHYLAARSPRDLYGRILVRWENDYEEDTDLVGDALSLLWAARRGLSESELKQLLGSAEMPFPQARWSPLYIAMSDSLVIHDGLITFGHQYLRDAVQDAYLPSRSASKNRKRRTDLSPTERWLETGVWEVE